jgi:hypothetical protein
LPTTEAKFLKNITVDKTNHYSPENCSWKKWTQMKNYSYLYVIGEGLLYKQFKRSIVDF